MNLAAMSVFPNLLPGFTRYYFEEWNRHHDGPEQLSSIEVWWMYEVTVAPGENPPAPEKILLGRYSPVVPAAPKGTVVVVGTLDDGQMIDLMRAGAPLTAASLDREPNGPIISPAYGPLTAIANSGAEKYVVGGFARFLLDDWNKANPERRVEKVEILRVQPGQRETLAEASR